jgi:hypothetical protein
VRPARYDSPVIQRPLIVGAALLLLAGCSSADPAPAQPPVLDNDEPAAAERMKAEPLTPERLQSLWWSWAKSATPSPVEDPTGAFCGDSQPFGVWLIAGSAGDAVDRHCQVPATLPLAGPAIGHIAPDAAGCSQFLAAAKGEALLDDKPVSLEKAEPTKITYETEDGSREGFSCGLWVKVDPLAPGEHRLVLRGSSGTVNSEASYDLTVVQL